MGCNYICLSKGFHLLHDKLHTSLRTRQEIALRRNTMVKSPGAELGMSTEEDTWKSKAN